MRCFGFHTEKRMRKSQTIKWVCEHCESVKQLADAITLRVLSRRATPEEVELYKEYQTQNRLSMRELAIDMLWMQFNSNEFLYNH